MEIVERKIDINDLTVGMYVSRLDRPWIETPFSIQGFLIRGREDMERLRQLCRHVFVDVEKGLAPSAAKVVLAAPPKRYARPRDPAKLRNTVQYADRVSVEEELPKARQALENAAGLSRRILADVRAGHKLSVDAVNEAAEPVVQSILRSSDAFFQITALRQHDAYVYSHAINCSALAAAFGRHMGFPEEILINLASGGLLLDVGKATISGDILLRPGPLDDEEFAQVKRHVENGLKILDDSGASNEDVCSMIRTHHERHDGSGYPAGLVGSQIPLFGRMLAVVDCFDAMTSDRVYCKGIARHRVLQQMYDARGKLFQDEIVEQFLQCISVYPTGSLVELSNGEIAIVMAQSQARRLRPKVMLLMSPEKRLYSRFPQLDLMAQPENESLQGQIDIVRALDPGAHGLNPAELYL